MIETNKFYMIIRGCCGVVVRMPIQNVGYAVSIPISAPTEFSLSAFYGRYCNLTTIWENMMLFEGFTLQWTN